MSWWLFFKRPIFKILNRKNYRNDITVRIVSDLKKIVISYPTVKINKFYNKNEQSEV